MVITIYCTRKQNSRSVYVRVHLLYEVKISDCLSFKESLTVLIKENRGIEYIIGCEKFEISFYTFFRIFTPNTNKVKLI